MTFGTLGAKSVVRDVARVMGLGYGDGDRLAKNDTERIEDQPGGGARNNRRI